MFQDLLYYPLGPGVEAFTTRRDSILPYLVIQGHQVHGSKVAIISRPGMTREDLEGYDAFVTNLPGVAIGVRTADCVPILIHDPIHHVIAAVHSGWKGTVQKIAMKTIGILEAKYKSSPEKLVAVIGPSIGPGDGSPMSGGHHIDLWLANKWILGECGLKEKNIMVSGIDTYSDPSFFSARREGIECGRNINAIMLKTSES